MNKLINNPNAEWHIWPNEVPELDGREIHSYLVRGVGGLDDKLHHWICEYVQTNDHTLKGWFLNGNEFRDQDKEFEFMDVDELYFVVQEQEEEVPKFFDCCRDFILDEIDNFEDKEVQGSDLGLELTGQMNNDGTFTMSCVKSKRYLRSWENEAGEFLEYEKLNWGVRSNPFKNVDVFIVYMVTEGVRTILSRCRFIDKMWNDKFKLTEDVISVIKEQVEQQTEEKLF